MQIRFIDNRNFARNRLCIFQKCGILIEETQARYAMFKIWAKTITNQKITRSYLYHSADKFNEDEFLFYLTDICHEMDIPTPVILKSHLRNYHLFNIAKFRKEDFVESIDFDMLQLENAGE